jgi:hypothetical protein
MYGISLCRRPVLKRTKAQSKQIKRIWYQRSECKLKRASTKLVLALSNNPFLKLWVHYSWQEDGKAATTIRVALSYITNGQHHQYLDALGGRVVSGRNGQG